MLIGVVAHTDHTIRQITEYAAAILAGDHRKTPGADGMALLCTEEGIDLRFFDGDLQLIVIRVEHLHNTVDLHARVVFIPQVRNRGVAHLPLGNIQIMSIAVYQTAPRPYGQHPALDTGADTAQILPVGKEIPLAAVGKPAGTNGEVSFTLHLDDNS